MDFSLIILCTTNIDRVNQMTPEPNDLTCLNLLPCCLTSSLIVKYEISFYKDNSQSASSNALNPCHHKIHSSLFIEHVVYN